MEMLNLEIVPSMFDAVVQKEFQSYTLVTISLEYCDQVLFAMNFSDTYLSLNTAYFGASIELDSESNVEEIELTNNFFAYLFEEARIELYNKPIAEVRHVGNISTIKGLLTRSAAENICGGKSGWKVDGNTKLKKKEKLNIIYDLKDIFHLAYDFKRILVRPQLSVILNRSKNDTNSRCDYIQKT